MEIFKVKYKGVSYDKLKPITKKESKGVMDTPRFPKVIDVYEDESKRIFNDEYNELMVNITKELVGYAK